jgi:hypothetical protein
MANVIETATSGRAKCRGCDLKIAKGELRFGERLPNMFGDGEMTLWFHPACAAYKRPEPFLEALSAGGGDALRDLAPLEAAAKLGIEHRRLPRVSGAERAPTGRARCRHCRETIDKGTWRIPLVYFEEARFEPSGFVHAACASAYFGTTRLIDRATHFNAALGDDDVAELEAALG